jgi:signal transduction histidine kinase/DNA-binding response OmpR family regulator
VVEILPRRTEIKLQKIIRHLDSFLTNFVRLPGETEDTAAPKKAFLVALVAITLTFFMLTVLAWYLRINNLLLFGLVLLSFFIPQVILFAFLRRGLKWFVMISNTFSILLSFWFMLRLGGITHSAGLIYAGLVCVVYAIIYPSALVLWWSFGLYLLTLILTAVLQPFLTPDPELTEGKNLLFFVLNSVWMATNILILVFYVYRNQTNLAKLKAQRLEEVDALKTRMFANIAHEFRTPLTLISGMAEMVREDPGHQLHERTESIHRNAGKVLRLVDQMLNLAKIEAGTLPVRLVQGDVVVFLRQVFQFYPGLAEYRKVHLHFESEIPHFNMDFDPDKLEEIAGNLISNALKFTPAGGEVRFRIFTNTTPPEQLCISVSDTGIGIPAEKLGYIFDRFYRVEDGHKHYEEGSGIGLTLVREYVRLLGGDIAVQSTVSKGTEFSIALPVSRNAPMADANTLGITASGRAEQPLADFHLSANEQTDAAEEKPLLLIIEDNPELSEYLRLMLGAKYRLTTAPNGEEGIHQAIEQVPDLVLSDVMMPVKDGYEVCRTLKKDFRTCHIPIVLLTARADATSRIIGLEQGADAYLTKPFNRRELLVCLHNLFLQRERMRLKFTSPESGDTGVPVSSMDDLFLKTLHSKMEKHFADENFGIEQLHLARHVSRVQLHRKLTALTGQSAAHFIRTFRLEKARA